MNARAQLLFEEFQHQEEDWTFQGAPTRALTHCYHDYPARMIPQIAGKLLDMFAPKSHAVLFDPYCGTGTSLVEGVVRGFDVIGTDVNPLARLIARAKTNPPPVDILEQHWAEFRAFVCRPVGNEPIVMELEGIKRPEFWFKPEVFRKLASLRTFVLSIKNQEARDFFSVAFSETAREASNTRRGEFKLYRYAASDLERHSPEPYALMSAKLARNLGGLKALRETIGDTRISSKIYDFNTVAGIPTNRIPSESVDIVLTSPPYGDSHTTVAYGQYSRLSAAWLGFEDMAGVDKRLMGGKTSKRLDVFPSDALNDALNTISNIHESRAREVAGFYNDLMLSISHISPIVKHGGYAGYVVGNRKVKGVTLPTDIAVRNFFEAEGYRYITTFHRNIPNKRMPSRNSPTNAVGETEQTMLREYIVVMQRPERDA